MIDYTVNIQAIISSFYICTCGLDIGLINSAHGIKGRKNWEKFFTRHSPSICNAILKVVDTTIVDALKEEIYLTREDKLKGRYSTIEIKISLKNIIIKSGIDEVDNIRITISFDM